MRSLILGAGFAGLASSAASPYMLPMLDSYIERGIEKGFGYGEAFFYDGLQEVYALHPEKSVLEWYHGQIAGPVVEPDGGIQDWNLTFYSLDEYRIGNNFLWWYHKTGDEKYKTAMSTIRHQINRHPRNDEGGFWHRQPSYPDQMWLDGIFMADTFYARWTQEFDSDNVTAWDDIILQYDLIEEHCRNHTTNLLVHGYDGSKQAVWADPETGASPLVWGRALGWYFMSVLEALQAFPTWHDGHRRLKGYFTSLAEGIKAAQDDESSSWWLIMTEPYPGMPGNYFESSAAAMFTFGLLQGTRLGLLPEEDYGDAAAKAYGSLVDRFVQENDDGSLDWLDTVKVGSLSSNASYEYYISVPTRINDARGGGAFLKASAEWEQRSCKHH